MLRNSMETSDGSRVGGAPPSASVPKDFEALGWRSFEELIRALGAARGHERAAALGGIHELVAHLARAGRLAPLEAVLSRLEDLARREGPPELDDLLERIAASEPVVGTLLDRLEDGSAGFGVGELCAFLERLRAGVLIPVLRRSERSAFWGPLRRCAASRIGADPDGFTRVIDGETDPDLLSAALGVVGEHRLRSAEEAVLRLQGHPSARVRRAAVGTSLVLRNESLLRGVVSRLEDRDTSVRTEAARGLGGLRYVPAAGKLAEIATSARLRRADLSEKRVVFDACGRLSEREAVDALDRILNGRRLLMMREATETRASAAHALGRARTPAARRALQVARDTPDQAVRAAARRALARMVRGHSR